MMRPKKKENSPSSMSRAVGRSGPICSIRVLYKGQLVLINGNIALGHKAIFISAVTPQQIYTNIPLIKNLHGGSSPGVDLLSSGSTKVLLEHKGVGSLFFTPCVCLSLLPACRE